MQVRGHRGREESGTLCAQLDGELREGTELLSLLLSPQLSRFMELRATASPAPLFPAGDAAGPVVERPWAAPQSLSAEAAVATAPLCSPADYYGRVLLCAQ